MASVTVGFIPRDRFCRAADSLRSIFDGTQIPFRLIVVDCAIPQVFRQQMAEVLEGRARVETICSDPSLSSNGCRNLVLRHTTDDYICLIENDVMVEPGWLGRLLTACEEHPADVAVPLLLEPDGAGDKVHFDARRGQIERTADGRLAGVPRKTHLQTDRDAKRKRVDFIEMHCKLFRRAVFDRIGPFDQEISGSRAEVDVSLALHHHGVPVVLEPSSRVLFSPPPPVRAEERDRYLRYWDVEWSKRDHARIANKWNLVECPSALAFCKARVKLVDESDPDAQVRDHEEWVERVHVATRELADVVPEGETLVLVDDIQWRADEVARGRTALPFLEKDGRYIGVPPDTDTAIRELDRMREAGARFVAFGWPSFWWLDHYAGLHDHLQSTFRCVLENDRLVVFDLTGSERA